MNLNTKDQLVELIKANLDKPDTVIHHVYQLYISATDEELGPFLSRDRRKSGLCWFMRSVLLDLCHLDRHEAWGLLRYHHESLWNSNPYTFGWGEYRRRLANRTQNLDPLRLAWVHHVLAGGVAADFKVPEGIDMEARGRA